MSGVEYGALPNLKQQINELSVDPAQIKVVCQQAVRLLEASQVDSPRRNTLTFVVNALKKMESLSLRITVLDRQNKAIIKHTRRAAQTARIEGTSQASAVEIQSLRRQQAALGVQLHDLQGEFDALHDYALDKLQELIDGWNPVSRNVWKVDALKLADLFKGIYRIMRYLEPMRFGDPNRKRAWDKIVSLLPQVEIRRNRLAKIAPEIYSQVFHFGTNTDLVEAIDRMAKFPNQELDASESYWLDLQSAVFQGEKFLRLKTGEQ